MSKDEMLELLGRRAPAWLLAPTQRSFLQVPRAFVASCLAAAVDFGVLVLLIELVRVPVMASVVVGYLVGGVVQYVLCCFWVFSVVPTRIVTSFLAFTVLSLGGLLITAAVMEILNGHLGLHYSLAKVCALGGAFAWNYLSRKYLLFRKAHG